MQTFNIKIYSDKYHHDILEFRKKIFSQDLNLSEEYLNKLYTYEQIKMDVAPEQSEDAYKFALQKWEETQFDNLFCLIDNGHVVGLSGVKKYGNYLRVSMHLYLLKQYRGKYINLMYKTNGYFERQIKYAQAADLKALFFSIYPHNKKTNLLLKNHSVRTISSEKKDLLYLNQIHQHTKPILFHCVPQHIFYFPLVKNFEFCDSEILN